MLSNTGEESKGEIRVHHLKKEYKIFPSSFRRLSYSFIRTKYNKPRIFTALEDVSFTIEPGEIVGIIGKNGAGKSTLLKMITGITTPTSGTLEVTGRIASLLELGAGFNPELTGIENVFFQGDLLGISRKEMEERLSSILEFADIGDFISQPVKNYSSGMFARLAFATAIHVEPDILIVDEVLSVGDIAFQFKCIEKMKEFAEKGVTILFVTHSMMSLYRFCNRAIWIKDGCIKKDGEVEDVVPFYEDDIRSEKSENQQKDPLNETNEYVKFKSAELFQGSKSVEKIEARTPFSIKFQYSLMQDLPETPYFAISILKEGMNKDSFGLQPMKDIYTLPQEKGDYSISINIENNYFNVGQYSLYFSIMEHNGIGILYVNEVRQFEISGERESLGLIDVLHQVQVKKNGDTSCD